MGQLDDPLGSMLKEPDDLVKNPGPEDQVSNIRIKANEIAVEDAAVG